MKPRPFTSIMIAAILLLFAQILAFGQEHPSQASSISGRVEIDGAPAPRARISAHRVQGTGINDGLDPEDEIWVVPTNSEGKYSITGLAAGRYSIRAGGVGFVPEKLFSSMDLNSGQVVTLGEGEDKTRVDFHLRRGGVITGQVTDAQGHPVIERRVSITPVQEKAENKTFSPLGIFQVFQTDDRGVYRFYGVRAGRYLISVGGEHNGGDWGPAGSYSRTYAPGTTDQTQAKIIEIKFGEEATDVNIRMGVHEKSYAVQGRVIDSENGRPVSNLWVFCIRISKDSQGGFNFDEVEAQVNEEGSFRLNGLLPGTYRARAGQSAGWFSAQNNPYYVDPVTFDVGADDLPKIELKAKRGSTVSGFALLESVIDHSLKNRLSQISLNGATQGETEGNLLERLFESQVYARISADGSFHFTGVKTGLFKIDAQLENGSPLMVARIERQGVDISQGVKVSAGEEIKDIRIVFSQGTGVVRGQAQYINGTPPRGWRLAVSAIRENSPDSTRRTAEVDEKGRFVIDGLLEGEYIFSLYIQPTFVPGEQFEQLFIRPVRKKIRVSSGDPISVTMSLDLSDRFNEKR